jgi:hypothetical protein
MFTNLWKKCVQWQASRRPQAKRSTRVIPRIEVLEGRITPSNYNTFVSPTGVLTLTRSTAGGTDGLTITSSGTFGEYTVQTTAGNFINSFLNVFTNATPVNAIVINTGSGADTIDFDGTANGVINLSAGLTITGSTGDKTITLQSVNILSHSALDLNFTSTGTETSTFTDVNVSGAATIRHVGVGDTNVTINTSGNNAIATNTWDTLAITNGSGSDINMIKDTDFAGNVSISNGAGASHDQNQFGGSENIFSAGNNGGLLNAQGNITISTSSGQSDTEIYDYNVKGTVAVTTGGGVGGQSAPNFVGIENKQTNVAVPTIGAVSINGSSVTGVGLSVNIGGAGSGTDFPVFIAGTLAITAGGSGAANIFLNDLTVHGATTITLGAGTSSDVVTLQGDDAVSSYGPVTVKSSAVGTDTYNVQTVQGTTNVTGALTFSLASAIDNVTLGLGDTGTVNTTGNLALTGVNGTKTLNVRFSQLGGISTDIRGTGTENFTFTDTNVVGAAAITHNSGATFLTITSSNLNVNAFNSWNSLTVSDGAGSDTNLVQDTSFAGSVTISNGGGAAGNTTQWGGSKTIFSDNLNPGLLTIHGNLAISTSSGQSDTEVYDYNVHGNVTLSTGGGISGQQVASFIGLEDNQTNSGSGTPVIGGNVTITGTAVRNVGVNVVLGTNLAGTQFFPLIINGTLNVTGNGTGSANLNLNDLIVAYGTTTITLAATTSNDNVLVQGTEITSVYWNFVINSAAGGTNNYDLQDSAGALQMTGTVKCTFGNGDDILNLGSNAAGFVPGAIVELFSFTSALFDGGNGVNFHFDTPGTTLFYYQAPIFLLI